MPRADWLLASLPRNRTPAITWTGKGATCASQVFPRIASATVSAATFPVVQLPMAKPQAARAKSTQAVLDLTGMTVGRFAIRARLGAGGVGEVYRADDTKLRRPDSTQPGNTWRLRVI